MTLSFLNYFVDKNILKELKSRKFIEEKENVKIKMRTLTSLGTKTEIGCKIYIDKNTGQKWERYAYDGIEHLRVSFYGLRVYPYISTDETIELIIKSNFLDEVSGASKLLFYLEFSGIEFREKLINSLEKKIKFISQEKFNIIYLNANLENESNLREIENKSLKEISTDYKYYIDLYERVEKLMSEYNNNL